LKFGTFLLRFSFLEFFKKNPVIDPSAIAYPDGINALLRLAPLPDTAARGLYEDLAALILSRQQNADQTTPRRSF
jgi:hypothetical protein